ncbi:PREDICTED: DNAJ protein JJJ1 homolog isoform X2 [Lupinus angustifolius]|uniref:DNAJ protein JJJ1 homolog isoform X2 n=1 Tax=Lupinus angustifolius TaxID=3871 RepID=UPI00092F584E|nr:PREDICTED: DNAJ protein JJJ1 homolog isoform X2 [Lupinus angustifolius]
MAASTKRCHYEVLAVSRDSSPDEIRSAYRRLALQRHPDKLVQSGISQSEATAQFQELQHAYEVLSDPKERAWYDSHRSQILFSDTDSVGSSVVPDLFSFFSNTVYNGYSDSGKGFYKVYSDVFDKIHANEINFAKKMGIGVDSVRQAPVMGNLESPYAQVTAFYSYWIGFATVMDFCWVDEYDVMAGPDRRTRRRMEEENNKARRKARKEYNDTVRKLADFVKKRDKRVIDMKVKKNAEMEKKKEEEREMKRRLEKEKKERAMKYEEPDWAKVNEDEVDDWVEELEEEEEEKKEEKEFYCVLCGKKFKSEKQWKNHEQSKKHKEKVAEFRDSLDDDIEEQVEEDLEVEVEVEGLESEVNGIGANDVRSGDDDDYGVDDLEGRVRDGLNVAEEKTRNGVELDDDGSGGLFDSKEGEEAGVSVDLDGDEEIDVLEAMVAGHNSRKPSASTQEPEASFVMEYDNRKGTRKKRGSKKERGRKNWEESNAPANGDHGNMDNKGNDNSYAEESTSQHYGENEGNSKGNEPVGKHKKVSSELADKKGNAKDTKTKAKSSSKGRKGKNLGNSCDACGEEFESRNKLHMHLGETGHATIKRR